MQWRQLQVFTVGLALCAGPGCYQGYADSGEDSPTSEGSGEGEADGSDAESGGSEEGSTGEIDRGLDGLDGGAMPPVIADPGDQVIDQHTEAAVGGRPELGDRAGQVVDAVQRLHHDAEVA